MLKRLLFKIAKGPIMGKIVGNAFRYCSSAMPVKKVYNSKEIIAFYHPCPSYENHIIISPKRAVKNLQQMELERFSKYFVKILEAAKDICVMYSESYDSCIIVANGGKRQEVQQVHFHMFTNYEIVNEYFAGQQDDGVFYSDRNICVLEHPRPNWEFHFVIKPIQTSPIVGNEEYKSTYLGRVLRSIDFLNAEFNIVQRGYSLIYRCNRENSDMGPIFHIISGKKLN